MFYLQGSNIGTIFAGMLGQLSVCAFLTPTVRTLLIATPRQATAPYLIIVHSEVRRAAARARVNEVTEYALRDLPVSGRLSPLPNSALLTSLEDVPAPS